MTIDKDTLEWAAQWIEGSLKGEENERVREFGRNMAMTLRAAAPEVRAEVSSAVASNDTWATVESTCGFCGNKVRHVCTAFLKGSEHAAPTPSENGAVSKRTLIERLEKVIRLWNNDTVTMACADLIAELKTTPSVSEDGAVAAQKAANELVDELFGHATQLTPTIAGSPCNMPSYSVNYVIERITTIISKHFPATPAAPSAGPEEPK